MTRLILASLAVLAISILPLYAQSTSLHTDRSGYTTGTDGNRTVNTYTDRFLAQMPTDTKISLTTDSSGFGGNADTAETADLRQCTH
jgi:hypothetical protein